MQINPKASEKAKELFCKAWAAKLEVDGKKYTIAQVLEMAAKLTKSPVDDAVVKAVTSLGDGVSKMICG